MIHLVFILYVYCTACSICMRVRTVVFRFTIYSLFVYFTSCSICMRVRTVLFRFTIYSLFVCCTGCSSCMRESTVLFLFTIYSLCVYCTDCYILYSSVLQFIVCMSTVQIALPYDSKYCTVLFYHL